MSNTNDLYKRSIFDHNRNPRNFREMADSSHSCDGYNPLCGDKVTVYLKLGENGKIDDISFTGSGCAIFKASASFMTTHMKGMDESSVKGTIDKFVAMVKGDEGSEPKDDSLGKLAIFQGVREFPSRVKCATLAWHALTCALGKQKQVIE